jgi:putative PIN family toxin of toxin-antitoxin system
VRIVLDSNILVRAFSKPGGLAYEILLEALANRHRLILSGEMLAEVTRVLRYPRMMMIHGKDERAVYDFADSLRERAEFVALNPLTIVEIRDREDFMVLQTALAGEAEVLCTIDRDFFEPPCLDLPGKSRYCCSYRRAVDSKTENLTGPS